MRLRLLLLLMLLVLRLVLLLRLVLRLLWLRLPVTVGPWRAAVFCIYCCLDLLPLLHQKVVVRLEPVQLSLDGGALGFQLCILGMTAYTQPQNSRRCGQSFIQC